ncbi:hypothetical protein F8M41_005669 [Gigaspora margarita]|uniref:Uncharacterized protein n=1 Tax=Gigaspora margarita TaxID=4874 RepID=A0A8H3XAR7_GIGMA|nr:hypothetical protein F8M41_005669 [Gigaspora margarita]
MNSEECDYETQAIFEKDCFYSVAKVIDSEFYNITYITTYFSSKLNVVDDMGSENSTEVVNSTRAKLLSTLAVLLKILKIVLKLKMLCNNEFKVNEDIDSNGNCSDKDDRVVKKAKCKKSVIYYNKKGKSGSG